MIRNYQASDVGDVLAVWEAATKVAHPFLNDDFLAQERHNIPNVYLPNAETWIWEMEGRVVGFIALIGNEVGAIFVEPRLHGSGIGRALMDHARDLRSELEVEVFEGNAIGRSFYKRYGFELMHEKVHEQTGFNLLRLRLAAE